MSWLKNLFKDEPEIIQMHHVPEPSPSSLEQYQTEYEYWLRVGEVIEEAQAKADRRWRVRITENVKLLRWDWVVEYEDYAYWNEEARGWEWYEDGSAMTEDDAIEDAKLEAKLGKRQYEADQRAKVIEIGDDDG